MRVVIPGSGGGFWMGPGFAGVVLFLLGVLIWVWPNLVGYFVAAVFMTVGIGLIVAGWRMRRMVSYRRIDEDQPH